MESSFLVACGKYDSATRTVRPSLGNAKELLAAQPDLIDAFDEDGWTCLHHAAGLETWEVDSVYEREELGSCESCE